MMKYLFIDWFFALIQINILMYSKIFTKVHC